MTRGPLGLLATLIVVGAVVTVHPRVAAQPVGEDCVFVAPFADLYTFDFPASGQGALQFKYNFTFDLQGVEAKGRDVDDDGDKELIFRVPEDGNGPGVGAAIVDREYPVISLRDPPDYVWLVHATMGVESFEGIGPFQTFGALEVDFVVDPLQFILCAYFPTPDFTVVTAADQNGFLPGFTLYPPGASVECMIERDEDDVVIFSRPTGQVSWDLVEYTPLDLTGIDVFTFGFGAVNLYPGGGLWVDNVKYSGSNGVAEQPIIDLMHEAIMLGDLVMASLDVGDFDGAASLASDEAQAVENLFLELSSGGPYQPTTDVESLWRTEPFLLHRLYMLQERIGRRDLDFATSEQTRIKWYEYRNSTLMRGHNPRPADLRAWCEQD